MPAPVAGERLEYTFDLVYDRPCGRCARVAAVAVRWWGRSARHRRRLFRLPAPAARRGRLGRRGARLAARRGRAVRPAARAHPLAGPGRADVRARPARAEVDPPLGAARAVAGGASRPAVGHDGGGALRAVPGALHPGRGEPLPGRRGQCGLARRPGGQGAAVGDRGPGLAGRGASSPAAADRRGPLGGAAARAGGPAGARRVLSAHLAALGAQGALRRAADQYPVPARLPGYRAGGLTSTLLQVADWPGGSGKSRGARRVSNPGTVMRKRVAPWRTAWAVDR